MDEHKRIILEMSRYQDKGLYIIFDLVAIMIFTEKVINDTAQSFWDDKTKLSDEIKNDAVFQRCDICPAKDKGGICDVVKIVLPFLEMVDQYKSYEEAIAVYRGEEKEIYYVSDTTMQEAFKYIAILALTQYCLFGKLYKKYFYGINPLVSPSEFAHKLYLNAFWILGGDRRKISDFITMFHDGATEVIKRQIDRLSLICKNDVFLNAFANTQAITEFMAMDIEEKMKTYYDV